MKSLYIRIAAFSALICICLEASAQKYPDGPLDKTIAVVGNEMITISALEP